MIANLQAYDQEHAHSLRRCGREECSLHLPTPQHVREELEEAPGEKRGALKHWSEE